MKKVLITGENSYIGTSVEKWLLKTPGEFEVTTISVRGNEWEKHDFSKYDAVFHVAGIAHIKETKKNRKKYYDVNYELTKEIGRKAKSEKVKQLIFLSSMSVYGLDTGNIKRETAPTPKTAYGKSKYFAENSLLDLETSDFKVAIIRPPMVYGNNCKGNFQRLSNFANNTFIFPDYKNQRSMIFIDNLSQFIKIIIREANSGIFFPQNEKYVSTSQLVKQISLVNEKKIMLSRIFNFGIRIIIKSPKTIGHTMSKMFGDLIYDHSMSNYDFNYNIVNFENSIVLSQKEKT